MTIIDVKITVEYGRAIHMKMENVQHVTINVLIVILMVVVCIVVRVALMIGKLLKTIIDVGYVENGLLTVGFIMAEEERVLNVIDLNGCINA